MNRKTRSGSTTVYRVIHQVWTFGWVDLDLGSSTILLGQ